MALVIPQIVHFDFGEDKINIFDMVSAMCTVNKGDLPIDIQWLFNGERVNSNDGLLISRTSQRISTISIESVQDRHRGTYTCEASNKAGTVKYSAELEVNGYYNFYVKNIAFLEFVAITIFNFIKSFLRLISSSKNQPV